jgi:hypothetical protein
MDEGGDFLAARLIVGLSAESSFLDRQPGRY